MVINLYKLEYTGNDYFEEVVEVLSAKLGRTVSVNKLEFDISYAYFDGRRQYNSTQILNEARKLVSAENEYNVFITSVDLFVPIFTFVFGEAYLRGNNCIVSVCRLHEEFYTGKSNYSLFTARLIKEILHELGHNFGLKHCQLWDCVMHSSFSIEEVDIKGDFYCLDCQQKIPKSLLSS